MEIDVNKIGTKPDYDEQMEIDINSLGMIRLKKIYNEIELGMEGRKVDMKNYEEIFNQGLVRLRQLIPEDALPDFYEEDQNDIYRTQRI